MHRIASNETTLVSNIANIVNNENIIIAPGQGKTPVSVLSDEFCEEHSLIFFPQVNLAPMLLEIFQPKVAEL